MPISVIVPSFNPPRSHLGALYASLRAPDARDLESSLIDDGSTDTSAYALLEDPPASAWSTARRTPGPPSAAMRAPPSPPIPSSSLPTPTANSTPECLARAVANLRRDETACGDTITKPETIFGRAVALLGFPGGGAIGFHNVWRVDAEGYTRSFSHCNLAFRKDTFEKLGRFNETFPVAGGEDTVLARHAVDTGHRIRYNRTMIVYHVERSGLRSFLRWQWTRGRGNYYIKKHVPEVGGYLRLRLWTFANSFAPPVRSMRRSSSCCSYSASPGRCSGVRAEARAQ